MAYKTLFFQNASDFLGKTITDLAKDETRNNLILGLALRFQDEPHAYTEQNPLMAIVSEGEGKIDAMAIMTPPFPMIVQSKPVNHDALASLADATSGNGWQLSGVNGEAQASDAFAQIWREKTGQEVRFLINLRAYELRKVEKLKYPQGTMRVAEESETQIAVDMFNAMRVELAVYPSSAATFEGVMKNIRLQRTFFWVDNGAIVSIANANRPQIKGICISGVYTPPEFRGKGYARALVAEVSNEMLLRGYELTNLFTDLANPTSNKIYQEVGYKPVCDYHQYSFG